MDCITSLTEDEQQELVKHLPDSDCDMSGSFHIRDKDSSRLKHPYLWESVDTYGELLGAGYFHHKNKDEREEEKEEASSFKDNEYESFYGKAWGKN